MAAGPSRRAACARQSRDVVAFRLSRNSQYLPRRSRASLRCCSTALFAQRRAGSRERQEWRQTSCSVWPWSAARWRMLHRETKTMYMRAFQETADSGTNDGRGARMDLSQTDRVSTHLLLFTS